MTAPDITAHHPMRGAGPAGDGDLFAAIFGAAKATLSLPEQIANRLVENIIRGVYAPGQRLQEASIAEAFGVSRGPVREALRIVEREGLANIRPRYGAFVVKVSGKSVAEIFEVRALLLALATRRVAEAHTPETLAFLKEGAAGLKTVLDDPERFFPLVYRCTMFVIEKADNDLARGILVSLARQTLHLTRVALLSPDNRRDWTRNWDAVVKAVADQNPTGAEAAMRRLVDTVGRAVLGGLRANEGDPEPVAPSQEAPRA